MDNKITDGDIDGFITDTLDDLHNFKIKLLQERVASLVGKVMLIERFFKDPISGDKSWHILDATIVGAQWTYEGGINFKVSYVHPHTGKTVETEEGA